MTKQTKGITLIALVITIIVLLILAGVTIVTLTGDNGLLQKTNEAKNTTIEAEGLERIKLAVMTSHDRNGIDTTSLAKNLSQINNLTDLNNKAIEESTEITLPKIIKLNNTTYEINADGEVYKYYNTDGLLLLLDGINNTRNGHSTTTTTWEDLSGNNNDFTKLDSASNALWSDNSYVGDATNRTLVLNKAILENSNECTVEVCYDIPKFNNNYIWIFQSRQKVNPANGFQFNVSPNNREICLWTGKNNSNYHSLSNFKNLTDLGKRTEAFSVGSNNIIFSDDLQFYNEDIEEGIINSVMQRDFYSIGSAYPWSGTNYSFKGNIYSIRVYNRKLSEDELKNNYEIDRSRFNMD